GAVFMNANVSSEITKYLKEKDRKVSADEIYTHFKKEGKTHGQISGALNRLKQSGRIVSPERAMYENTNSSNVLREMEQDIKQLIDKYNHSVPITIYNGLNQNDKDKYTKIIQTLQELLE
ncbi:hypothetical protein, partial [Escherichia coli]|uniref:hypothetical protein n=1 Tax=Escherichia coli TaxID=562 RepID=UPI001C70AA5A